MNSPTSALPDTRKLRCCDHNGSVDDVERKTRILNAASSMLTTHGYHAASMDSIAACSGMSKKTLYQFFESKKSLFETLIIERLFAPLPYTPVETDPLPQQLQMMMTLLAEQLLNEERLGLLKSIITETTRNPAVRQIVTDLFHLSGRALPVQQWLTKQAEAGHLHIENVEEAADLLFSMTLGGPLLAHLTHCKPPKEGENLIQFIAYGIQTFLKAHST
ncbi:TetR/AcrR family transcriptional regulator [Gluconobacter cerinus]|uniref:TetR/AcrR family transcriptional regulator n=1 Tax=Gluconobacter TaxID=441 RepID=UPI00207B2BFC|nr:TetR/AcrR family transcriptional regulator [Gluconobacter cerinus]